MHFLRINRLNMMIFLLEDMSYECFFLLVFKILINLHNQKRWIEIKPVGDIIRSGTFSNAFVCFLYVKCFPYKKIL